MVWLRFQAWTIIMLSQMDGIMKMLQNITLQNDITMGDVYDAA